ncbi:o-succinylbenzoate--CoA ligase [Fructilactobacillus lindneri]|uniref:2-succinylbenzoate--CoA ligase n=1 Tax=Fructilactobacillus lindneri DSM 20690 = JCM 11027 TaxID=1122148 RepID=A0A0R2JNW2_9LACO|nr:o-succinylbenzoate--CoA ligase [Fructilactobacillus lindneri]KRN78851.1 2-succinylbenzoate--CoA ligase [Fructilactobacillus lindneri DSM 20690 = JCM 11027]POH06349.1 o-succinylbenzoate--CoA ligase [Fructilactobacillus lindneri]POH07053.1 o-succinylbenzoate--CoA ligase [Fructilactobacillus lindneri]POH23889.1 o-succinylbenzoate--CoA ligase [Fructilactobacillus lindneri DSM 20690 = JCM 11027]SJZ84912.1 O-succinylbenzoic acid--CoA ligase [Fructilactobacillus lindneri DSM 20690 = JCM 11027]
MDNWLQKRALLTPKRMALSFKQQSWNFTELKQQVIKVCNHLVGSNIQKLQRVAILGNNTPQLYFTILALQQLGIEIVFINKNLALPEIHYQLQDAQISLLIYADEFQNKLQKLASVTLISLNNLMRAKTSDAADFIKSEFDLNQVTSIMYTSGTTGKPKGVLQTYRNHWSSAIGANLNLPVTAKDTWICAVPLFHISGFSIMMRSLIYGMSVRLYDHFDEESINHDLITGVGTIISVVPYMLKKLLSKKSEPYSSYFSYMLLGGGEIDIATLQACRDEQINVIQSYGMTETASQVVALNPIDAINKIGSVGKPLFPVSLKIADSIALNQVGQVLLKAANISPGYLNETNHNQFTSEGWFKTGDLGYLDSDGFLYLKSRLSELIISGGENIYPREVENVINQFPGIVESAVIGKQNSTWGSVPVAFIVTNKVINLQQLSDYLTSKMAKYKVPKQFILIDELPKTNNGKIRRKLLQSKI